MVKHIAPPVKSLFGQNKDTKLNHFLQAVPFLTFSEKGLINVAKRFKITVEELKQHIAEFEAREGQRNA